MVNMKNIRIADQTYDKLTKEAEQEHRSVIQQLEHILVNRYSQGSNVVIAAQARKLGK
jgi:predicted CopG family antitoxin